MEASLFGIGVFPIERISGYTGVATSEIGILAAFSQYGLVIGGLQVALVLKAIKVGVDVLLERNASDFSKFASLVVLTLSPIWVFEAYWRIGQADGLVFWYCVFYLAFIATPRWTVGTEETPGHGEYVDSIWPAATVNFVRGNRIPSKFGRSK